MSHCTFCRILNVMTLQTPGTRCRSSCNDDGGIPYTFSLAQPQMKKTNVQNKLEFDATGRGKELLPEIPYQLLQLEEHSNFV